MEWIEIKHEVKMTLNELRKILSSHEVNYKSKIIDSDTVVVKLKDVKLKLTYYIHGAWDYQDCLITFLYDDEPSGYSIINCMNTDTVINDLNNMLRSMLIIK